MVVAVLIAQTQGYATLNKSKDADIYLPASFLSHFSRNGDVSHGNHTPYLHACHQEQTAAFTVGEWIAYAVNPTKTRGGELVASSRDANHHRTAEMMLNKRGYEAVCLL